MPRILQARRSSVLMSQTLGHQRLISLLLPLLLETSRSNPSSLPRIISTSSTGHTLAPKGGFNPISVVRDPDSKSTPDHPIKGKNELGKWPEYGQSKWGNIAVARYVHWMYGPKEGREKVQVESERVGEGEVISISLHPGELFTAGVQSSDDTEIPSGIIATNLGQHLPINRAAIKYTPWLVVSPMQPAPNWTDALELLFETCICRGGQSTLGSNPPGSRSKEAQWRVYCALPAARSSQTRSEQPRTSFGCMELV